MMASLRLDVHYVDVHDWTQNVSDPSITDLRRAKLPDTEVENRKVDQYLQEEDKRMCLASRLLPRYLVNKATAVPFREVSVMNRERRQQGMFKPVYGPPYTKPLDPSKSAWEAYPSFSISHDSGMVAMAVHPLYGVGVDIQCLALPRIYNSARQFIDEMRGDVLSENEYGFIDSHTADEDRLRGGDGGSRYRPDLSRRSRSSMAIAIFYRIWTAKESYQKCVGLGFALPMTELEVDQSEDISRLEGGKWASQRSGFRLKSFTLGRSDGTEFVGCVCVVNYMGHIPSQPVAYRQIPDSRAAALRQDSEARIPSTVYGTIRYGSVEEVEELLRLNSKAMAAYEDASGLTPVILAAKYGRADVVEKLLEYAMPVGSRLGVTTPLLEALGRGKCDCVDLFLERRPGLVEVAGLFGATPLMSAAAGGCVHCVEAVLRRPGHQHGSEELETGRTQVSAMEIAVATRRQDVVKLMLDNGIEPDRWSVEESVRLQDNGVLALLLDALSESPNDILDAALVAACHDASNARLVTCLLRERGARATPAALQAAADSTIAAILLDNSCSLDLSVSQWVAVLGAHVAEPAVLETLWSWVRIPARARTQALEVAVAQDAPSAIVRAVENARKSILTRDDIESTLLVQSAQCGATRCLYYLLRDYATISISLPKIRLK
ncbi:hypothetical protein FOZ62_027333, partial [Perkinsus olseni]